jgi:hypothetical protein
MPAAIARPLTPMPWPDSKRAPHFNGSGIKEFLDKMEACAKIAGLGTSDIPKLIPQYCSKKVKSYIEHYPEIEDNDWGRLKATLIDLFGSRDRRKLVRPDKLREFSKKSGKATMNTRRKLDDYTLKFQSMSIPLIKNQLLTEKERDLLFYKGLSSALRKKIRPLLEMKALAAGITLSITSPPLFDDVLQFARCFLKVDDYDSDSSDDVVLSDKDSGGVEGHDSNFDLDPSSEDDDPPAYRHRTRLRSSEKVKKAHFEANTTENSRQTNEQQLVPPSTLSRLDNNADIIAERFERLLLNAIEVKIAERLGPASMASSAPSATASPRLPALVHDPDYYTFHN